MTKGFSNSNRFVTTLISTINFMTMDFDYLNYVTSTKLKNVNDKSLGLNDYLNLDVDDQMS